MVLGECYWSSHRFVKTTTKYKEKPTGIKIELPNDIVLNSKCYFIAYMPTLPDYHQESPRYCTDLPPSCMCQQILQIKWTFELFWALVWNLAHFSPSKFNLFFIHCMVSGTFLQVVTDRLFHHYNDESKFWLHIRSQVMATGSICRWGGGGGGAVDIWSGVGCSVK